MLEADLASFSASRFRLGLSLATQTPMQWIQIEPAQLMTNGSIALVAQIRVPDTESSSRKASEIASALEAFMGADMREFSSLVGSNVQTYRVTFRDGLRDGGGGDDSAASVGGGGGGRDDDGGTPDSTGSSDRPTDVSDEGPDQVPLAIGLSIGLVTLCALIATGLARRTVLLARQRATLLSTA